MSAKLIEIALTPELDAELARWIERDAQLPAVTAGDMATPEMVELTARKRYLEAKDLVQRLWTILESKRVRVLDMDVLAAVGRLRERSKMLTLGDAPPSVKP